MIGKDSSNPYFEHLREKHKKCLLNHDNKMIRTLKIQDYMGHENGKYTLDCILFDDKYFLVRIKVEQDWTLCFHTRILAFEEEAKNYSVTIVMRSSIQVIFKFLSCTT